MWIRVLAMIISTVLATAEADDQVYRQRRSFTRNAARDGYPYVVTFAGQQQCGGALIAPDVVLTAGHCAPSHLSAIVHIGRFQDDIEETDVKIVDMVRHPDFERVGNDSFRNDYLLLKLQYPVTHAHQVMKINRDPQIPASGAHVVVVGTGNTLLAHGENRSNILQDVALAVVTNAMCEEDLARNSTYQNHTIEDSHLCFEGTGGLSSENYPCAYDSGSPIILAGNDEDEDALLVALASWGTECADPGFPVVNARVSSASDWIDATMCDLSEHVPLDFPCEAGIIAADISRDFFRAVELLGVVLVAWLMVRTRCTHCCQSSGYKSHEKDRLCSTSSEKYSYHSVEAPLDR